MRVTVRAATFVAAAVTLAATAFAGPSLAWDVEATPVVPVTAAHAAASVSGRSGGSVNASSASACQIAP